MSKDHVLRFHSQGYAVIPGLFDADEVAGLADAFDRIYARGIELGRSWRDRNVFFRIADDSAQGPIVRYAQWVAWIDETLERTRRDPRILKVLEPIIGRDLKQIINQLHWKPPGAAMADFGFHQDSRSRQPRTAYRDLASSYVQTGIAVDPHTAENGAMVICPGSHRLGELPFDPERHSMDVALDISDLRKFGADPDNIVTLELAPGDFALWHVHTLQHIRLYINGYVAAANCDRGEWAFREGVPCPLQGDPALVHYEGLHSNPGPMYVD